MPFSKLYILTKLSADDVKYISADRQQLTFQNTYTYGTINSIFVEIQPDSTNIKNAPRILLLFQSTCGVFSHYPSSRANYYIRVINKSAVIKFSGLEQV